MSMQGNAAVGSLMQQSREDIERYQTEQRAREVREAKYRCIELACRTNGPGFTADDHAAAAKTYYEFITS